MSEDIIIQSEPEKQDKNQISEKSFRTSDFELKFSNASDFELKFSNESDFETKFTQRVRFWFKGFTTRQILDWAKYNALDFESKIFRHVKFWKNVCIQKITFSFFLLRQNDIICIFRTFLKSIILNRKFHYVSDFEVKKNTTRQILNLKKIQRVIFWI